MNSALTAVLFGVWYQISGPALFLTIPIAVWEFSFGVYMTFKGFRPTAANGHSSAESSASFAEAAA